MRYRDERVQWEIAVDNNDFAVAHRVLIEHSELLGDPENVAHMMYYAASHFKTGALEILLKLGVDPNLSLSQCRPESVLWTAANSACRDSAQGLEVVRWLIARGARVNFSFKDCPPYCYPLMQAIQNNQLEMVQVMVATGEDLNVLGGKINQTPLSWALENGRTEIANYLRSRGALESHEVSGYLPTPPPDPELAYVEDRFGKIHPLGWIPIVGDKVPVAVRASLHPDCYCLFTQGMSTQPMIVPTGGEPYQYAELVLPLGEWEPEPDAWQSPQHLWAIQWLRRISQYPFENNTWLGGRYCVISNDDPPKPLSEFTEMTCWLLVTGMPPLVRVERPDGRMVVFYTLLPIHTAERDFERKHGLDALLKRFLKKGVPEFLVADRKSAV